MARGIDKRLRAAIINVNAEIRGNSSGGRFASGLSAEGYAGGFRDALYAIDGLLRGIEPSDFRVREYFTKRPSRKDPQP